MCASLCKCVCTYMCIWKCRPNVSWFFHLLPSPPPFFFRAHISFIYRVDGGIKLMSFAYRDSRRIVGKCQLTFEASEAGFGFGATNLYRIWLRHGDLKCMLSKYKRRQLFNWSRHFRNILNVYMIFVFNNTSNTVTS